VAVVCVALGFGLGWAAFSWQPWRSSPGEHDAEVAVLKATRMAAAGCRRREYPTSTLTAKPESASGCADLHYTVRFASGRFEMERRENVGRCYSARGLLGGPGG
jgi:hypothetical protein